ncbi:hypothetical protein SAMD00019534_099660 [Acytostelium subglobosum LB1]|uniref:hypothetical protein n=1 Tax=Acytostelium subglobosum LB1 TaxID=1410327 RepID=UPI00064485E8|nr:hypothetical protein SAMD00019534_099660 [Acytostelium subglobosum LB1]GAM26791.1 hypothetical protein SAMD00019534_099660 [Acytostelium subglobosum LB1]|eukprot:XP_012750452.1 hypothetical protein SAMD00019534_099660 [Acytostelium subglobosum LB1]
MTRLHDARMQLFNGKGNLYITKENTFATYTFEDLRAGEYCIVGSYPNGSYIPGKNDNKFNNGKFCTSIPPNEDNADFGMVLAQTYTIQGSVFYDVNNDGVLNTANLLNGATIEPQTDIGTNIQTLENVTGSYSFAVPQGTYCIVGRYPDGTYISGDHIGDNVFTNGKFCTQVPPNNLSAHFGMKKAPTYVLEGIVWDDTLDNAGVFDSNKPIEGAAMEIQFANGTKTGTVYSSQTGVYSFVNLLQGRYCVVATKSNYLPGFAIRDNVYDNTGRFCTDIPPSNSKAYCSMIKDEKYTLQGMTFNDKNNGVMDPNDLVKGVNLELQDNVGGVITSQQHTRKLLIRQPQPWTILYCGHLPRCKIHTQSYKAG